MHWHTFSGFPDKPLPEFPFVCENPDHGPLSREFIATGRNARCPICGSTDVKERSQAGGSGAGTSP